MRQVPPKRMTSRIMLRNAGLAMFDFCAKMPLSRGLHSSTSQLSLSAIGVQLGIV